MQFDSMQYDKFDCKRIHFFLALASALTTNKFSKGKVWGLLVCCQVGAILGHFYHRLAVC